MGIFRNIEIFRCDNDLLKRRSSRAISRRLYLFWFCFAFHSIFCCCWPIRRSKSYNSLPNSREQVSLNIAKYLLAFFGRCCCYRPFNCNHACRTGGVPEQKVLHPSRRDFRKKNEVLNSLRRTPIRLGIMSMIERVFFSSLSLIIRN